MNKPLFFLFLLSFICTYSQIKYDTTSSNREIEEVVLISKDPISEKFSVKKLGKMDIYLNPASNADPLRAISTLPASTNVEETANPSLRGGSPDRSRVYLNGSPIVNPVRFGRDNGLGNFSLFNTEIIDKQYVYASNPPLTFGNSSAGLVEIETNNKLREENFQVSLALSNVGAMWNQKISENSFVQLYGNYQFDNPFLELNKNSVGNLISFSTLDFGANTHIKITDKLSFNSFNYFIDEKYNVVNSTLNFTSDAIASKNRFFSVNNIDYTSKKTRIRYATMFDFSTSNFTYGNLNSTVNNYQYFNAIGVKTKYTRNFIAQYGIESSIYSNRYNEKIPIYYYALSANSPVAENVDDINFYYIEPYLYLNYEVLRNFGVSGAIRKNILWNKGVKSFVSYQLSSHYEINNKNRFILSGGKYHSYTMPNNYVRDYTLLSSEQLALDYYYESKKINISSAIYYKDDKGNFRLNNFERYDKIKTFGFELNLNLPIYKNFRLDVSNSYVHQKQFISDTEYNTALNLKYFIKTQLIYNNPHLFNCSLLFTTRPGNNYTSVHSASFNSNANDYEPSLNLPFASTFSDYNRFDFSISKLVPLKKSYIIAFASVNNIFDKKNQSSVYYNKNYTKKLFNYFQRRILYFGMQLRF
ncbi:MAG: hypothetical protein FDW93_01120 [Bergeyella sp.]|nr:hypothetical protein [Bergeyella sp.]